VRRCSARVRSARLAFPGGQDDDRPDSATVRPCRRRLTTDSRHDSA
jgi:hypothetical protein